MSSNISNHDLHTVAVADFEKTRQDIDNDRELFDEIVQMFLEDSPALIASIRNELSSREFETCRRNAHTLKGLVSVFFAERCRQAAERVEKLAGKEDCKNLVDELESSLNELHAAIRSYQW
jgi:HPt (histidine-containing phosphotransfer) domain-containing protein